MDGCRIMGSPWRERKCIRGHRRSHYIHGSVVGIARERMPTLPPPSCTTPASAPSQTTYLPPKQVGQRSCPTPTMRRPAWAAAIGAAAIVAAAAAVADAAPASALCTYNASAALDETAVLS